MIQAYLLSLEVSFYSGVKRKIEIAEAFSQTLVTVLRRALKFSRSSYPPTSVNAEDDGEVLTKTWRDWVEHESMKRLAYHVFLHDAQLSVLLGVPPSTSYAEMRAPLPGAWGLWTAKDALHWKRLMLSRGISTALRVPCLREVLQDISQLGSFRAYICPLFSSLIVLHGLWSMIWEHRQLSDLKAGSKYWSDLVLSSRRAEICSALQHFHMDSAGWGKLAPEVLIVEELMSMHLYMSIEELQLYAGKGNKEDAKKVYFSALQWIGSPDSRQAVWHAGQIIRAARSFRSKMLNDFYAFAVYQASMAFWSYGVVARAQDGAVGRTGPALQALPLVLLDEEETPDLQRFITLNRGQPGLRDRHQTFVPLGDVFAVMTLICDELCKDWDQELLPTVIENTCQLLRGLGKVAQVAYH